MLGRIQIAALMFVIALAGFGARASAADKKFGPDPKAHKKVVDQGVKYLLSQQASDGSFNAQAGPGFTALAVTALIRVGRSPDDPAVAKGLKYVEKFVQEEGGIHGPKSRIPNYENCLAIQCLVAANADKRYDKILKGAEKVARGFQINEADGKAKADFDYGGSGYGDKGRPDLSNTAYLVEALHDLGAGADDQDLQRALVFISRCQNLESEHNTTPDAAKINDGGFYYSVAAGGASPAGRGDEGGLGSYGGMTYSGLKSMIYAGVSKDDPRVKAAMKWLQKNYDLKQNPPIGNAGLFYYYVALARCLDALGEDEFEDAKKVKHDWRKELFAEVAKLQTENGSWVNDNKRWMESDPTLVTSYSLLVLSYLDKPEAEKASK